MRLHVCVCAKKKKQLKAHGQFLQFITIKFVWAISDNWFVHQNSRGLEKHALWSTQCYWGGQKPFRNHFVLDLFFFFMLASFPRTRSQSLTSLCLSCVLSTAITICQSKAVVWARVWVHVRYFINKKPKSDAFMLSSWPYPYLTPVHSILLGFARYSHRTAIGIWIFVVCLHAVYVHNWIYSI